MLQRASISVLLKSVILTLCAAVILLLALSAWDSWRRLSTSERIAGVVDAEADFFTALHNLRVDRSTTFRDLNADRQFTAMAEQLRSVREAETRALAAGLAVMATVNFPGRQTAVESLERAIKKLAALHQESATALLRPKAGRRPTLAREYFTEMDALIDLLGKLSSQMIASVKLEEPYIDQLLVLKQLAWIARNSGGDASVLISNGIGGQPLPADALLKYYGYLGKVEMAWEALEGLAAGLPLPARFQEAVAKAKTEFLGPDYSKVRLDTLKALIAGQPASYKTEDWTRISVAKLATLLEVAEAALDVARDHAAGQRSSAMKALLLQLGLLVLAVLFGTAMMLLVAKRVINPLRMSREVMQRIAEGDFTAVMPGLDRKDEIGDVANAVEQFKVVAVEKAKREADAKAEQDRHAAAERDVAMQRMEQGFETAVGSIVQAAVAGDFSRRVDIDGKTGLVRNVGSAINALCDNVAAALEDLTGMLDALAEGDLTCRMTADYQGNFAILKDNANKTAEHIGATIADIKASAREVTSAANQISASTTDLSQRTEEQAAGLEETSASMEEIAATVKKNAEKLAAGQQVRRQYPRHRRARRRGGGGGGQGDGQDRGLLAPDCRHHRCDRRDRAPDQPARAQRRGRGGACRRRRPRLRRGGLRGSQSGAALLAGREGHQEPHHQQQRAGEGGRPPGQPSGRLAQRDRRIDQDGSDHRRSDRQCQRRAGDRHRAGHQGHDANGRRDAAELGSSGGECRHRQDARAAGPRHGYADRLLPDRAGGSRCAGAPAGTGGCRGQGASSRIGPAIGCGPAAIQQPRTGRAHAVRARLGPQPRSRLGGILSDPRGLRSSRAQS